MHQYRCMMPSPINVGIVQRASRICGGTRCRKSLGWLYSFSELLTYGFASAETLSTHWRFVCFDVATQVGLANRQERDKSYNIRNTTGFLYWFWA
jgi:hypothetical protein